jgi:hypothetical protein
MITIELCSTEPRGSRHDEKMLATAIAASLFSLSVSADESVEGKGASGADSQIVLATTLQMSEIIGDIERPVPAGNRENAMAVELGSEKSCSAKTFCPLD